MSTYLPNTNENKGSSLSNEPIQKKSRVASVPRFVDNRPEASVVSRLQSEANSSPQVKQLQALTTNPMPIQRQAIVHAEERDTSVVITADGEASDFQGGTSAKNNGWNGVKKYKGEAKVGDNASIIRTELSNDYLNAQAGHVLAEQNGGNGGDPDNVFAQDGGVNNGTYRSTFENPMRTQLNDAAPDDNVRFRVVLYGDNITQGPLVKVSEDLDASEVETDFEGFSSDEEPDEEPDTEIDTGKFEYNSKSHDVQGMINDVLELVMLDEQEQDQISDAFRNNNKMEDAFSDISHALSSGQLATVQDKLPAIYRDNMK